MLDLEENKTGLEVGRRVPESEKFPKNKRRYEKKKKLFPRAQAFEE